MPCPVLVFVPIFKGSTRIFLGEGGGYHLVQGAKASTISLVFIIFKKLTFSWVEGFFLYFFNE